MLFKRKDKVPDDRSFMEKALDLQNRLEASQMRFGKGKYGRVLKMTRKPTNDEFAKTSKITGAGILAIGGLGFLVFLIAEEVAPWIAGMLGL
jgi:protein transport protein SEC61 subunit gamma-like protein